MKYEGRCWVESSVTGNTFRYWPLTARLDSWTARSMRCTQRMYSACTVHVQYILYVAIVRVRGMDACCWTVQLSTRGIDILFVGKQQADKMQHLIVDRKHDLYDIEKAVKGWPRLQLIIVIDQRWLSIKRTFFVSIADYTYDCTACTCTCIVLPFI